MRLAQYNKEYIEIQMERGNVVYIFKNIMRPWITVSIYPNEHIKTDKLAFIIKPKNKQ